MHGIKESDWRILRTLKNTLLNGYCDKLLIEVESIVRSRGGNEHTTYLNVWDLLQKKDKEIGYMFDDLKRSNAIMKIFHMVQFGALTLQELEQFSPETKDRVKSLLEIYQG